MSRSRQLAAIMFTDIKGYTAIMQSDEQKAVDFRTRHREIFEWYTQQYKGRIIQYYGDGTLSIFHSAVEATQCAVDMQQEFVANEIPVRIGLHIGDIILTEQDIIGDGVNLASRVETLALAGSILVTEKVVSEIKNQTDLKTKYLGEFRFKNDHRPRKIYAIDSDKILVPSAASFSEKARRVNSFNRFVSSKRKAGLIIAAILVVLAIAVLATLFIRENKNNREAIRAQIMQISDLIDDRTEENFERSNWEAFKLIQNLTQTIPEDTALARMIPRITHSYEILSNPPDAQVYIKRYGDPDSNWLYVGKTPMQEVLVPMGFLISRIVKPGYESAIDVLGYGSRRRNYRLAEEGSLPDGMVLVRPNIDTGMLNYLGFMGKFPGQDFYFDKYEVTNREYKRFVDAGGYTDKGYWKYTITDKNDPLTWDDAMAAFVDQSGRPGPSTWEGSNYPAGADDHPVSGVSWYEAAAYAEFVGKSLPTWTHNRYMASMWAVTKILPESNFNGVGTVASGTTGATSHLGVEDMLGNVGEWCLNTSSAGSRFILGGGWDNPSYVALQDDLIMDPIDRSKSNGFRCMQYVAGISVDSSLLEPISIYRRDYYNETPVSDELFDIFLNQFIYDKTPLNSRIEYEIDEGEWIKQKVTLDATYAGERVPMYLFLPKRSEPPFQTVVYWPGSNAKVGEQSDQRLQDIDIIDYILRSGRAVVYPIYKGSYERQYEDEPVEGVVRTFSTKGVPVFRTCRDLKVCWKEERTDQLKDLQRCLDYLETRNDIDLEKLAFKGRSWGGRLAPMVLAVEDRFSLGIVLLGGFSGLDLYPESDPFHYAPRVNVPVLMLGGEYDNIRPLETLQRPYFEMLGTPEVDKRLMTFKTAHYLPRADMIKEVLNWLDERFGPAQ